MDIIKTPWLETDLGCVTPERALREAKEFRWGRGDWDMASFCLLHALVQTAVVLQPSRCESRHQWEALRSYPPEDIGQWIDLPLGDHPWECLTASGEVEVSKLIPETPGENTLKKSSDIARWRQDVPRQLSLAQATIALLSDNLWGTRIGTGFYQGARGEQALMTLVEPEQRQAGLWERIWLNVLPADEWQSSQDQGFEGSFEFPWKKSIPEKPLTPSNAHALDILWPMPRRWRLIQDGDGMVRRVHRQNKGRDYEGWEKLHPLTPYFVTQKGEWTAAKISPHTGFGQWSSIALQGRTKTQPAKVVTAYLNMAWSQEPLRLRCCGWALGDAGAAGGWVDHVVPFYIKANEQADLIEIAVQEAEKQQGRLRKALDEAGCSVKRIGDRFYSMVEASFYRRVSRDDWSADLSDWKEELKRVARDLYWATAEAHHAEWLKVTKAALKL